MSFIKSTFMAALLAVSMMFVHSASALEIDGYVGVATQYIFRGVDSANENPQISGDIFVRHEGAYAGVWATNAEGTGEYDLIVGYGNEYKGFSYDVNLTNYVYPETHDSDLNEIGFFNEIITTLGYGPVEVGYAHNIGGDSGYSYTTVAGTYDKFTLLVGFTDNDDAVLDYTHADLTYQYNDNIALMVSKVVEQNDRGPGTDDNLNVVLSYSYPFTLY